MNITEKEARYIEGYAAALQDIQHAITGENGCNKSYDPMTVESNTMHSYAFDMRDGGRHHSCNEYEDLDDIKKVLLNETHAEIIEDSIF